MFGKERTSNCPEGWAPEGMTIPLRRLTANQEFYCRQAVDNSRFVYNLAAATHRFCRMNRLPWPSDAEFRKTLNACKGEDYPWLLETAACVTMGAALDFAKAVRNWRSKEGNHYGSPNFKRKSRTGTGSFLAVVGVRDIKYDGRYRLTVQRLGSVKLCRELPEGVIPYEVRIKRENGRWYASVAYYREPYPQPQPESQSVGGVDVGINPLTSWVNAEGEHGEDENPKAYYLAERKLARWQRIQQRRTVGSNGWWQAQRRIDKCHRRIKGLRDNAHHQVSKRLVMRHHTLGIETLNVAGMVKASLQSKALTDAGIGGLLHKIRYKAMRYGTALVEASQWYPSSKTCSACGEVNAALERQPNWRCPACGVSHDRNHNAARNLLNLALGPNRPDVTAPDLLALAGGDEGVTDCSYGQLALAL